MKLIRQVLAFPFLAIGHIIVSIGFWLRFGIDDTSKIYNAIDDVTFKIENPIKRTTCRSSKAN